jgi:hypothetical protein
MKNEVRQSDTQPTPYQGVVVVESESEQKIAQFNTLIGWLIENDKLESAVESLNEKKAKALFTEVVQSRYVELKY